MPRLLYSFRERTRWVNEMDGSGSLGREAPSESAAHVVEGVDGGPWPG